MIGRSFCNVCRFVWIVFFVYSAAAASVEYADNFRFEATDGHRSLILLDRRFEPPKETVVRLVNRKSLASADEAERLAIEADSKTLIVPVRSIATTETVQIGFLAALNVTDRLVAVGSARYVTSPDVVERLRNDDIAILKDDAGQRIESLFVVAPELTVLSQASVDAQKASERLLDFGLKTLVVNEHLESHPLARMEWIKVYGALLGKEALANKLFAETAARYEALAKSAKSLSPRPSILFGAPYSGSWYVPAGESYMAQFIADAGGRYLWAETKGTGSLPLDFERIFIRASDADVWINPSYHRSKQTLLRESRRLERFRPLTTGRIFNQTRQTKEGTTNPIWEKGVLEPDRILQDLIKIFHPSYPNTQDLSYYELLE